MNLPEQLQRQVDEAQSIIEQHYGTGEPGENPGQQGGETPAVPEPAAVTPTEPTTQVSEPGDQPVVQAAPTPAEDANSPTFEQRWRSLQGIYNATAQQKAQLEGRVQQLEQLISAMQTAPVQTPSAPQVQSFITDKDSEEYGKDMVDFAKRAALEVVRSEMAPIAGALQALREELGSVRSLAPTVGHLAREQHLTKEERFFNSLAAQVPDWQQVNSNTQFHAWLLTPDAMTGISPQTYLDDAQRSFDVGRVVAIFNKWKEVSGTSANQNPSTQRTKAQQELERQVAPGSTLSAPPPSVPEKKTYSRTEIAKFYDDVRKGVYRGREAEMREIERDIFVAQREGRLAA